SAPLKTLYRVSVRPLPADFGLFPAIGTQAAIEIGACAMLVQGARRGCLRQLSLLLDRKLGFPVPIDGRRGFIGGCLLCRRRYGDELRVTWCDRLLARQCRLRR